MFRNSLFGNNHTNHSLRLATALGCVLKACSYATNVGNFASLISTDTCEESENATAICIALLGLTASLVTLIEVDQVAENILQKYSLWETKAEKEQIDNQRKAIDQLEKDFDQLNNENKEELVRLELAEKDAANLITLKYISPISRALIYNPIVLAYSKGGYRNFYLQDKENVLYILNFHSTLINKATIITLLGQRIHQEIISSHYFFRNYEDKLTITPSSHCLDEYNQYIKNVTSTIEKMKMSVINHCKISR